MTERSPPFLEGLLQSAPFGMSVMSAAGETVFANEIAKAVAGGAEENCEPTPPASPSIWNRGASTLSSH